MFPHSLSLRPALLALAVSSLFSPAASAASATDLDALVVTASRTEQTLERTLAATTVIERPEIERLQPNSVQDLLRGLPGISITNNGGPGKSTSVLLRGAESDHLVVLVDGVRIGSATAGGASLQDIPVDQIERIEIVRGPFSSLYGSEAIGGVIQIFTRQPEGRFAPFASLGVGSYGEHRASAGLTGRGERGWYALSAAHQDTDGINVSACHPDGTGDCVQPWESDRDGYRNTSLNLRGGYRFSRVLDGEASVLRARADNHYDGNSASDSAKPTQQVVGGQLRYRPTQDLTLRLNAGQSRDESDNYFRGVYSGFFNTRRDLGSLQMDAGAGAALWTLGWDWQRDRVASDTVYTVDQRIDHGLFGQWQQSLGAHHFTASLRRDENSQFGGKTTGSAAWGWDLNAALRLSASYGTAFKAPTFNELYYPGYGRPDLKPESSRSWELGLRGSHAWGHWSLNGYDTRVDNLIAYDASIWAPSNIDKARIRGVEVAFDGELGDWIWRTGATWLDPREAAAGVNHDNILPRRARQTARFDLDRTLGAWSVGASLYAAGRRYDNVANTSEMGGYALTDFRVALALNADWKLRLALNNAFDRHYETARWYNQPGRNWLLTLSWRPAG